MAESLVDLKAQMDAAPAVDAPEEELAAPAGMEHGNVTAYLGKVNPSSPIFAGVPRGDDLMDQADEASDFSPGEKAQGGLIKNSIDLVFKRADQDAEFAAKALPKVKGLSAEAYAEKMVSLADDMKIDWMRKNKPELFNGPQAAMTAFLNEATFGQLSRMIGYTGAVLNGQPAEEVIRQKGEEFRLLAKAYPGLDFAGKAAAFLVPGSPTKALFEGAAKLGTKGAAAIIKRIVSNPSMLQKVVQVGGKAATKDALGYAVAKSAAGGAAGGAAVGGVQGGLGEGLEEPDLNRALEHGAEGAAGAAALGALAPLVGAGFSKGLEKLTEARPPLPGSTVPRPSIARSASNTVKNVSGRLVEELSGTPANSIRQVNRNPAAVRAAYNSEAAIGEDYFDFLTDPTRSRIPEAAAAEQLLDKLPRINPDKVINFLRGFGKTFDPDIDPVIEKLHGWADRIELAKVTEGDKGGKISARTMNEIKRLMQKAGFTEGIPNFYRNALRRSQYVARNEILEAAKNAKTKDARLYGDLMKKAADKTTILKFLKKKLGRTPEAMAENAEKFADRVFGKDKSYLRARLADLDTRFTDPKTGKSPGFMARFKAAQVAQDVGNEGGLSYTSNYTTGKSTLGTQLGSGIGGGVGGLIGWLAGKAGGVAAGGAGATGGAVIGKTVGKFAGGVASSPKLGSLVIGSADSIAGFMNRVMADPEVIDRLAGKIAKGPQAGGKTAARLAVPWEIKRIAQEISNTLAKDGPKSASGVVRLVADTPYFMGLVHYFDLMERRHSQSETRAAIEQLRR